MTETAPPAFIACYVGDQPRATVPPLGIPARPRVTGRPARALWCEECDGSAIEVETVEVYGPDDEYLGDIEGEVTVCACCEGRGWFPPQTAAEVAAEVAAARAAKIASARAHLASGECEGRSCWAGTSHRAIASMPELAAELAALADPRNTQP